MLMGRHSRFGRGSGWKAMPLALTACIAGAALPIFSASAQTPQYLLPLDGDTAWSGRDGAAAKPAIIHGASKWTEGVSGKALQVTRHAYDQVTALVADSLPNVSTRHGTLAFWFRPEWEPARRREALPPQRP